MTHNDVMFLSVMLVPCSGEVMNNSVILYFPKPLGLSATGRGEPDPGRWEMMCALWGLDQSHEDAWDASETIVLRSC